MITYEQWIEKVVKGKKRFIYTKDGYDDVAALRTSEACYRIGSDGKCEIESDELGDINPAEDYYLTEEELDKELDDDCSNCPKNPKEKKKK